MRSYRFALSLCAYLMMGGQLPPVRPHRRFRFGWLSKLVVKIHHRRNGRKLYEMKQNGSRSPKWLRLYVKDVKRSIRQNMRGTLGGPVSAGGAAGVTGLPFKVLSLAGQGGNYQCPANANIGATFNTSMTDMAVNGATGLPAFALVILDGAYNVDIQLVVKNQYAVILGTGTGNVKLIPVAGLTGDFLAMNAGMNPYYMVVGNLTADCTNIAATALTTTASPWTYTHAGGDAYVYITNSGGSVSALSYTNNALGAAARALTPNGAPAALPNGLYMTSGDVLVVTFTGAITATKCSANSIFNFTASTDTYHRVIFWRVRTLNTTNVTHSGIFTFCQETIVDDVSIEATSDLLMDTGSGSMWVESSHIAGIRLKGISSAILNSEVGNVGLVLLNISADVDYTLAAANFNGVNSVLCPIESQVTFVAARSANISHSGRIFLGASGTPGAFIGGYVVAGNNTDNTCNFIAQASRLSVSGLAAPIPLHLHPGAFAQGFIQAFDQTAIQLSIQGPSNNTTFNGQFLSAGGAGPAFFTNSIPGVSGTWSPVIVAVTSQKAETQAADASVLSFTPPAQKGAYRIVVTTSILIGTGTNLVIQFKLNYQNAAGANPGDTIVPAVQLGTAAPALSFTTSASSDYQSSWDFDTDNSASPIVLKWVGGAGAMGTASIKVTATLYRIG